MSKLTTTEKITKDHHKNQNLGVLYTGYLEKQNPRSLSGSYRKRFVVLTHESLHWFTRTEGYDLFGEERGNIPLGNIVSSRILDEDSNIFEVVGSDSGLVTKIVLSLNIHQLFYFEIIGRSYSVQLVHRIARSG